METKCSICGCQYTGIGNNAEPINSGRCCDLCDSLVTIRRINDLKGYQWNLYSAIRFHEDAEKLKQQYDLT